SLIGTAVIEELNARRFSYATLSALDDQRNVGTTIDIEGEPLAIDDVSRFDFSSVDLAFFCGRAGLSERHARAAAAHAWVIDGSSASREAAGVPLVVADVNASVLEGFGRRGLIALPGSASVALATALAPLASMASLKRVEVMTCHAVSGSG